MRLTTVDVSETEFVINQATFYLAFLIALGSAGAIIANVIRGINNRIKKNREEQEAKAKAAEAAMRKYVEERMKEVDEAKARVDYMYWKIVDQFFDDKLRRNRNGKSG